MQRFYLKLSKICQQKLLAKKYLIMPSYSAGLMVQQAAAKRGIPLLDLELETITGLLSSKAAETLHDAGRELITDSRIRTVLLDIFRELREEGRLEYLSDLELTSGVLDVTATTILEMRLAGLGADELMSRDDKFVQPAKGRDVARIIKRFEERLSASGYADRAAAIKLYLEEKTGGKKPEKEKQDSQIFMLPDSLELSPLEEDFLECLGEEPESSIISLPTPNIYNLKTPAYYKTSAHYRRENAGGEGLKMEAPSPSESEGLAEEEAKEKESPFSYLFAPEELTEKEEGLENEGKDDEAKILREQRQDKLHLRRAYGKSNEIRSIFRRIKEKEIPLDRTAIFYTTREPYSQLCFDLAGKLDLPITFGDGISIKNTRPGKLYFKLLDWIASDYSVKYLYRALHGKLIDPEELKPPGHKEAAEVMRRLKIGWRRERYEKLLAEEVKSQAGGGENTSSRAAKAAQDLIHKLFSWLPESGEENAVNTGELAGGLSQVLENIAALTSEDPRQRSYDEEARNYISDRLKLMAEHYQQQEDLDRALSRLEDLIDGSRVGKSFPRPGHLHVCSYREARWLDRPHNFLVGLDAESFPGPRREDPILLDDEREELGGLELKADRGRLKIYHLAQGLASLEGEINLSYSCFDTTECSEIAPAPAFLQVHRLKSGDPDRDYRDLKESLDLVEEFVPDSDEKLLTENSLWLKLGHKEKGIEDFLGLAAELFPGLSRGLKAFERRWDDSFNPYCGNVSVDPEEVDPGKNDETVSSSKLERMATCPFNYFLQNVLKIEEPEDLKREPLEWLDAMERGSLLHSIYEKFYREITRRGEKPDRESHDELLQEIARLEAEEYRKETPPPSEMVYEQEMREIIDSCRFFLASEEEHSQRREPLLFEFYFGRGRRADPDFRGGAARIELPSGAEIEFSGIIDRVDRLAEGEYEVIDYKTGSTYSYSGGDYFKNGRQLQHALYALALEDLARDDIRVEKSGYVFASRKGEGQRYMRGSEGRKNVKGILEILFEAMAQGAFPPARNDRDYSFCNICDFNEKICERERYDDMNKIWQDSDHEGIELLRGLERYE